VAPPLVLLHGFTHTGASWDGVRSALGESYKAVAPDIRGHGSASAVSPVTLDGVIEDVAALVPGPFTLCGYSMGGRIALHVAVALGVTRVQRLVLIGASPGIASAVERRARLEADLRLADEIEGLGIEEVAVRWAATPVLAGQPAAVGAAAHADRLRNTPGGLAAALRGLGTGALPSLWGRLGDLSMPVALVVGERDSKFRKVALRMGEQIGGGARVVVVPGVGHAAHLEAPERVASVIGPAP
jgi:2-succinyl-6-hydroxy-2,4-cyclohexadiene-1-carboxylate synthase